MPPWHVNGEREAVVLDRLVGNFVRVKRLVSEKSTDVIYLQLHHCPEIEVERRKVKRAFMHVGHVAGVVCSAWASTKLDDGFQLGLLAHEFSHLMTPGGTEQDADIFFFETFGIPIIYRGDLNLEWIDPKSIS